VERFEALVVLLPKARGATLISTVVLRQLRRKFPHRRITCIAEFPELLYGSPFLNGIVRYSEPFLFDRWIKDNEVVDLTGTLDYQPNRRQVPVHLIDLLCGRAGVGWDGCLPDCSLTDAEVSEASRRISSVREKMGGLPCIAMTTSTSTPNKEWPVANWTELVHRTASRIAWIHLGTPSGIEIPGVHYLRLGIREDIAVLKLVDGAVCLDTFLLHAAASQRSADGRVVVLLGSTRPECVSYSMFLNIFDEAYDCQPCCRPFHPLDRAFADDGALEFWPDGKPRKWVCDHVSCMKIISVDRVEQAIGVRILQENKNAGVVAALGQARCHKSAPRDGNS
jgi:ADP-heptose:LPS heptosyltransferase